MIITQIPDIGSWIASKRNKLDIGFVLSDDIVLWVGDPWNHRNGIISCNKPSLKILSRSYYVVDK